MRVLVTGGTGFLGSYLSRYLAATGVEVTATFRPTASPHPVESPSKIAQIPLDVRDPRSVAAVFERARPDVVYHLAGQPFVTASWEDPLGTLETNLMGTLRMLEQVRAQNPRTRFAFAGSGTEYGTADVIPTDEEAPLRPASPYAASKAGADLLCYQYFRSFGIPVLRCRIFGTTGWGKRGDMTNDFASQIAAAERTSGRHVLRVGNLETQRDVTDVRDAVRAIATVVDHGEPGRAYNIGSGVLRSVRGTLESLVHRSKVPISTEPDPARDRRVDEPVHLANTARLRALGWTPEIPYEQTLEDVLNGWRSSYASA